MNVAALTARLDRPRIRREGGTLATRLFAIASGLASGAVTARALGPEQRGAYFYVVALANLLAIAASLGLSSANGYFAARQPQTAVRLVGWSAALALGLGGAAALMFLAAVELSGLARYGSPHGLWLLLLVPSILGSLLLGPLLAGLHRFAALNLIQAGQQVLTLAAFVWIARLWSSPGAFLAASAAAAVAGGALQAWAAARDRVRGRAELAAGEWLRYGLRAYGVLLLGAVLARIGVFFVRAYAAPGELGQYSVASQVWDGLSLLPSSIATVLFPTLVRDNRLTWKACRQEMLRMLLIVGGLLVLLALCLRPAILLVFGAPYAESYGVSLWLLPGFLSYSATVAASQFLAAKGFPAIVAVNWLCAAAVLVLACSWLTPRFGAAGVAMSVSLSHLVLAGLMVRAARGHLEPRGRP